MEMDDALAKLATRLDKWFDGSKAAFASEDHTSQRNAILRGIAIIKDIDQLKAEGLSTIGSMLERKNETPESERSVLLVRTFEFAAKLEAALNDELLDTDGANTLILRMNDVANALDATSKGRAALAALLDHPDERVRASAGAYLVNLIPERVIPILREIDEKSGANSAGRTAHWALLDWELREKACGEKK